MRPHPAPRRKGARRGRAGTITGLPTRAHADRHVTTRSAPGKGLFRPGRSIRDAAFVDVRRFADHNAAFGYNVGDRLIRAVADMIEVEVSSHLPSCFVAPGRRSILITRPVRAGPAALRSSTASTIPRAGWSTSTVRPLRPASTARAGCRSRRSGCCCSTALRSSRRRAGSTRLERQMQDRCHNSGKARANRPVRLFVDERRVPPASTISTPAANPLAAPAGDFDSIVTSVAETAWSKTAPDQRDNASGSLRATRGERLVRWGLATGHLAVLATAATRRRVGHGAGSSDYRRAAGWRRWAFHVPDVRVDDGLCLRGFCSRAVVHRAADGRGTGWPRRLASGGACTSRSSDRLRNARGPGAPPASAVGDRRYLVRELGVQRCWSSGAADPRGYGPEIARFLRFGAGRAGVHHPQPPASSIASEPPIRTDDGENPGVNAYAARR